MNNRVQPRLLLVVGGNSNAAKAFRNHVVRSGRFRLRTLVRNEISNLAGEVVIQVTDYFSPGPACLQNVDVVINFTRLVKGQPSQLEEVNAKGPAMLARAARNAGTQHFIQISSLSVYGSAEDIEASTTVAPRCAYGKSKLAGDIMLAELSSEHFTVTSLRVPILYNKAAQGKLHRLGRAMSCLQFFPVPYDQQPRSILHLDNLAVAIETLMDKPGNGVRFAADAQPFTFARLANSIAQRKGRAPTLLVVPKWILALVQKLAGNVYASLYGRSLIAEDAKIVMADAKTPQQCMDEIAL